MGMIGSECRKTFLSLLVRSILRVFSGPLIQKRERESRLLGIAMRIGTSVQAYAYRGGERCVSVWRPNKDRASDQGGRPVYPESSTSGPNQI